MRPLLGAVADDFTGATDLADMLARGGMATELALGRPPPDAAAPQAEAVVVALKSRTAPVDQAVGESLAAWRWLAAAGARQCYFKYCSTFDSTPQGNIGPVALALMAETGAALAPYAPAFPENGRTVRQGKLFVFDRLLSETGMATHPLTPMTDADLCRWLAPQIGGAAVGLVPFETVEAGPQAVRARLAALRAEGVAHAVLDTLTEAHLRTLAAALADAPLVTGGSGLGLALPANFELRGEASDALPVVGGPVAMLSGSCSEATNAQLAAWEAADGAVLRLDPRALTEGRQDATQAVAWAEAALADGPALVAATQPAEAVRAAQAALGRERAAALVEATLAEIARTLRRAGVRRFVVAGGETAGAVAAALDVRRLRVGPRIAPGVPWCATLDAAPLALALKSGNFGGPDFFAAAAASAP